MSAGAGEVDVLGQVDGGVGDRAGGVALRARSGTRRPARTGSAPTVTSSISATSANISSIAACTSGSVDALLGLEHDLAGLRRAAAVVELRLDEREALGRLEAVRARSPGGRRRRSPPAMPLPTNEQHDPADDAPSSGGRGTRDRGVRTRGTSCDAVGWRRRGQATDGDRAATHRLIGASHPDIRDRPDVRRMSDAAPDRRGGCSSRGTPSRRGAGRRGGRWRRRSSSGRDRCGRRPTRPCAPRADRARPPPAARSTSWRRRAATRRRRRAAHSSARASRAPCRAGGGRRRVRRTCSSTLAHALRLSLGVAHERRPQAPVADARSLGEVDDAGELDRLDLRGHAASVGAGVRSRAGRCRRGRRRRGALDGRGQLGGRHGLGRRAPPTPLRAAVAWTSAWRSASTASLTAWRAAVDGAWSRRSSARARTALLGPARVVQSSSVRSGPEQDRPAGGVDLVGEARRLLRHGGADWIGATGGTR